MSTTTNKYVCEVYTRVTVIVPVLMQFSSYTDALNDILYLDAKKLDFAHIALIKNRHVSIQACLVMGTVHNLDALQTERRAGKTTAQTQLDKCITATFRLRYKLNTRPKETR